jgi:hypothetical protein
MLKQPDNVQMAEFHNGSRRPSRRSAREPASGRGSAPRRRRLLPGWLLLGIGAAALAGGVALGNGLVIATGLVLASIAIHLLDDTVRPDQHRPPS